MCFSGDSSDEHPNATKCYGCGHFLPLNESMGAGTLKCVFVADVSLAGTQMTQCGTTLTLPRHYGRLHM